MERAAVQPAFPLRMLVVDDYEDARNSMCLMLRIWGYQVEPASDGPQALAAAAACRPDVVLIELAMPGMDGYETARRLREHPEPPFLVAVTTFGREEDRQRTRRAGFVAHVVKPAEPEELRVLLGRAAGHFRVARQAATAPEGTTTVHRRQAMVIYGAPHEESPES